MIPKSQIEYIPRVGGIYFLYNRENTLVYLGKTNNLNFRIKVHRSNEMSNKLPCFIKPFEYVKFCAIEDSKIRTILEKNLIKSLKPSDNWLVYK